MNQNRSDADLATPVDQIASIASYLLECTKSGRISWKITEPFLCVAQIDGLGVFALKFTSHDGEGCYTLEVSSPDARYFISASYREDDDSDTCGILDNIMDIVEQSGLTGSKRFISDVKAHLIGLAEGRKDGKFIYTNDGVQIKHW